MDAVSKPNRLAAYRYVLEREARAGKKLLTSAALGNELGINATQVRRDLAEALKLPGLRGQGYDTTKVPAALANVKGNPGALLIAAARAAYRVDGYATIHAADGDVEATRDELEDFIRRGASIAVIIDRVVGAA